MKAFTALVTVALAVSGALGQALTINTPPSAVVCQPLLLEWSGGTPPYFLSILPGNQPGAAALVDFGSVEGNSRSWLVNLPANTQIGLNLRDSTGVLAQSAPFTIQPGTDTSCLNASSTTSTTTGGTTSSSTTTTGGSTTTSTTVTTRPTTTATTTPPATTSPATRPASTTSTAPATTSSGAENGAAGKLGQISVAGAVGAVAAILLA